MRKFIELTTTLKLLLMLITVIYVLLSIGGDAKIDAYSRYEADSMAFLLETFVIDPKSAD